jgi:CelD/BcsL family acetyltransferase involved in cellulose biosynthesis
LLWHLFESLISLQGRLGRNLLMAEVLEIDNIEELSQVRMLWNSLFARTPAATFFHTLDWLEIAWKHFGQGHDLRVLVAKAAGEPLGILPLCIRTEKYRLGSERVLTYPLDNWSTWYGPIGPNPSATLMAATQHLRSRPRDWDMIDLRWVGPETSERGRTARAMRVANLLSQKSVYQTTTIVDLPDSWQEFLAAKPHEVRHELRRTLERTFGDGRAQYVRHRPAPAAAGDGDPRWDLYELCEQVAQSSRHGSAINGHALTHDRVRDYFRDAHAAAARLGMVDMNLVTVGGRPASFLYSYHHHGQVSASRTGFDRAIEDRGEGLGVVLKSIEDGIGRGDRTIDLGHGPGEHKRRLRTRFAESYRLTYAPISSWRSQTVRWSRWAQRRWHERRAASAEAEAAPV